MDMHIHLRDEGVLRHVTPVSAQYCSHLLPMPNLTPAILTHQDAADYAERITAACRTLGSPVPELLMTTKLTQQTTPEDILAIPAHSPIAALKLYPEMDPAARLSAPTGLHLSLWSQRGGVTTNAHGGVYDPGLLRDTFKAMSERGLVLCIHAATPGMPTQQQEEDWLARHEWLFRAFPDLRIVVEHVSTRFGVEFVKAQGSHVAATITAHHLFLTHEDVVGGKIQPHHHCMPTPNREEDLSALLRTATSGDPKFFFGSDSAPHVVGTKECASGCAGVYTAPVAAPALVQLFKERRALEHLPAFTSGNAARFYGTSVSQKTLHFARKPWKVGRNWELVPFLFGQQLEWQLVQGL